MFETALVALDLAPAEQPIIDCLPELRRWGVQRIVLTHVIQLGYMQGAALAHEQDYVDWLDQLAEPLRAAGLEVSISVRAGPAPADEILAEADKKAADLIVIGSRGHNLLSRLFLGSTAREVLRRTTRPVLLQWIEPSAQGTQQPCAALSTPLLRQPMLATDLSEAAAGAERVAIELASKAERIDCLHVIDASSENPLSEDTARAALTALLQRVDPAASRGEALLSRGRPSDEIAAQATRSDSSLIVLGKHGENALRAMLIGSTAAKVCENAGRPVLLVP